MINYCIELMLRDTFQNKLYNAVWELINSFFEYREQLMDDWWKIRMNIFPFPFFPKRLINWYTDIRNGNSNLKETR